jgi:SAM-dependent methyltransferase
MLAPDYSGLGALAWELYSSGEVGPDYPFFRDILRQNGTPALDVGCATGRLLIPLLEEGLEVDGVEPGADVLAICQQKVQVKGLKTHFFAQTMQTLNLPRRYRTIIVPCGTIQLVVDRAEVWQALRRLYAHLEAGGLLALTLFSRYDDMEREQIGEWKFRARRVLTDGTELEKHAMVVSRNNLEQTLECQVRYRRWQGEELLEELLCDGSERWFYVHELTLMLEQVGFTVERITGNYTDAPADDTDYVYTFFARR